MIIEAETDNKNRTHMIIREQIKRAGGVVTPTTYLFQKKGRIAFEKDERNLGVDEVLDEAIEAGAEDVETDEEGNIVVWTEPNMTTSAAGALQKSLDLKVISSDIIWDANEDTKVSLSDDNGLKLLSELLEALQDNSEVQGVYANLRQGDLPGDVWENVQNGLDA
jgi:transcriptional/translational regulatory protein YebC/TACO1